MWQISSTKWVNPQMIVHVEDAPGAEPPTLRVTVAVSSDDGYEKGTIVPLRYAFHDGERLALLHFLALHSSQAIRAMPDPDEQRDIPF